MRSEVSLELTRLSNSLSATLPATTACDPDSSLAKARSRRSSLRPASALSGPWHRKQRLAKIGCTSRSKSTAPATLGTLAACAIATIKAVQTAWAAVCGGRDLGPSGNLINSAGTGRRNDVGSKERRHAASELRQVEMRHRRPSHHQFWQIPRASTTCPWRSKPDPGPTCACAARSLFIDDRAPSFGPRKFVELSVWFSQDSRSPSE